MHKVVTLAVVALLALGCGGNNAEEKITSAPASPVAGVWDWDLGGSPVVLTLTESGSAVAGYGSLEADTMSLALTITGVFENQNVSLHIKGPGHAPMNLSGVVRGNLIFGTLTGSGYANVSVMLRRRNLPGASHSA